MRQRTDTGNLVVRKRAVLIAGPTASGKSALALQRAREMGGVIVNADALQVYDGLRVVTARPSDAEMAEVPHRLYGTVAPAGAVLDRRLGARRGAGSSPKPGTGR